MAQPKGAPPLPPFNRWAFQLQHYLQYLADMHAVHGALERALASARASVAEATPAHPASSAATQQPQRGTGKGAAAAPAAVQAGTAAAAAAAAAATAAAAAAASGAGVAASESTYDPGELLGAARIPQQELKAALMVFSPKAGFDRSHALLEDAQRLLPQAAVQPASSTPQPDGLAPAGSSEAEAGAESGPPVGLPAAGQAAAAYADYMTSLARQCQAAESGGELQGGALRLLAHAYTLHLVHLTSGTRVAAAAADKLGLLDKGALGFYR